MTTTRKKRKETRQRKMDVLAKAVAEIGPATARAVANHVDGNMFFVHGASPTEVAAFLRMDPRVHVHKGATSSQPNRYAVTPEVMEAVVDA